MTDNHSDLFERDYSPIPQEPPELPPRSPPPSPEELFDSDNLPPPIPIISPESPHTISPNVTSNRTLSPLSGYSSGSYASYQNAFSNNHTFERLFTNFSDSTDFHSSITSKSKKNLFSKLSNQFSQLKMSIQKIIKTPLTPKEIIQEKVGSLLSINQSSPSSNQSQSNESTSSINESLS